MTSRRASNTASNLVYIHRACGPQLKHHSETVRAPNTAFDGLVAAALDIAKQDTALRRTLKEAILRDDTVAALDVACALVGVEPSGSILALILSRAKAIA